MGVAIVRDSRREVASHGDRGAGFGEFATHIGVGDLVAQLPTPRAACARCRSSHRRLTGPGRSRHRAASNPHRAAWRRSRTRRRGSRRSSPPRSARRRPGRSPCPGRCRREWPQRHSPEMPAARKRRPGARQQSHHRRQPAAAIHDLHLLRNEDQDEGQSYAGRERWLWLRPESTVRLDRPMGRSIGWGRLSRNGPAGPLAGDFLDG